MLHLLKIEWLKVKNYKAFWILSILFLVSIWGINYIVYLIQQRIFEERKAKEVATLLIGVPPYSFPRVWQMTTYVSSYLLFIPGLIMIILLSNEYSYKTHRQNIIDGLTRKQFITTKLIVGVVLAIIATITVIITAFGFGIFGEESISFDGMTYIFYFFLQALSFCWIAIIFSLLFKRSGIAIGVFFLYGLVLENVLVLVLNHYLDYSGRFLPIESSDAIIPAPLFENLQKQLAIKEVNVPLQLAFVVAYLAAYFFLSKRKFETDDL